MSPGSERLVRQAALTPPAAVAAVDPAVVVGCGAVGRQVALLLAGMGVPALQLWDDDRVGPENLAPQLYPPTALGAPKADWCKADCVALNPAVRVEAVVGRMAASDGRHLPAGAWLFCCVDTMAGRRGVWRAAVDGRATWFGDARAGVEQVRVMACDGPAAGRPYEATLVDDAATYQAPCGTKMSQYLAVTAAGLLVAAFARRLRDAAEPDESRRLDLFTHFAEG